MKIRNSGMLDQGMRKEFFSPSEILETLEFNSNVHDAVEFGCGYSRVRGEDQLISDVRVIKNENWFS